MRRLLILLLTLSQTGCAVYTAASAGSYIFTQKGLSDHGASLVTQGDCNLVKHTYQGKYVCEMPVTYNQSSF